LGQMGYGLQPGLSPNITSVNLGSLDTFPPNPVPAASVGIGAYANHVDLQWPQTTDDPNGTGVYEYQLYRNGQLLTTIPATQSLSYSDTSVVPSTTYSYALKAIDYHFNAATTTFSVNTPHIPTNPPYPSVTPDGRRIGVRPTGTYWGANGETWT